MIRFELNRLLPSLNQNLRANRWRQSKPRERLAWEIKVALGAQIPPQPLQRARVTIERHANRELDPDNLAGSMKGLIDILQPSSVYKYGLGVIQSDSPKHLERKVSHVQIGRSESPRIVVVIEELE